MAYMAHRRVTMQDIADACGLSRNTISKIFNGRGAVPEATKRMVLQKAQELGYHQFPGDPTSEETPTQPPRSQNIALFTNHMPTDYHFGTFFLPAFTENLSRAGYTLMLYEISQEEMRHGLLPPHMALELTAGIVGIELFEKSYLDMLCGQNIPTILIDSYTRATMHPMKCDFISMENHSSMAALTSHVIEAGAKRLGFVGDAEHCNSFQERWAGFCFALDHAGVKLERELCILASDTEPYDDEDWLIEQIRTMPAMPDAFVCANDFLALHMLVALKRLSLSIPKDVMVTGFDGTPQSAVVEPSLTTVQIPSVEIGRIAADTLLERIEHPGRPFRNIYVMTAPIYRGSTQQ